VSSSKIRTPDVSSTKQPANSVRYTLVFWFSRKWLFLNFISYFCWKIQRLFTSCLTDQVRKSCHACIVLLVRSLKCAVSMSKRKERRENIERKVGNATVMYPGVLFFSAFMQVNDQKNIKHSYICAICSLRNECMNRIFYDHCK